jgi:hypothetical protein
MGRVDDPEATLQARDGRHFIVGEFWFGRDVVRLRVVSSAQGAALAEACGFRHVCDSQPARTRIQAIKCNLWITQVKRRKLVNSALDAKLSRATQGEIVVCAGRRAFALPASV